MPIYGLTDSNVLQSGKSGAFNESNSVLKGDQVFKIRIEIMLISEEESGFWDSLPIAPLCCSLFFPRVHSLDP